MNPEVFDKQSLIEAVRNGHQCSYLFFWGHRPRKDGRIGKQCFSQWYEASFEIGGVRYSSAECFMMAEKARLFHDQETFRKIVSCSDPDIAKKLGRTVRNFDEAVWIQNRFEIVVRGNLAKFQQNEDMGEFLLGTRDHILVEASPVDSIWGIGLAEDDARSRSPERWLGLNLLGFALMKVRSVLDR